MNAEPVLLRPKIRIPPTHPEFIRRPRLTNRINLGVQGPLTVLSAPAGFGKTQALVEWARQSIYPVAWLTLSPEDNDILRFYRYVISALQVVEPHLGEETLGYLLSSASSHLEVGLAYLANEIFTLGRDIALVLDDYHLIDDPSLVASLYFPVAHLPSNLHLLIASRGDARLDIAPLRAKGQVSELGTDELRLTNEEIGQFFKQTMRLQLPPKPSRRWRNVQKDGWSPFNWPRFPSATSLIRLACWSAFMATRITWLIFWHRKCWTGSRTKSASFCCEARFWMS